jgi:hypothetical protein
MPRRRDLTKLPKKQRKQVLKRREQTRLAQRRYQANKDGVPLEEEEETLQEAFESGNIMKIIEKAPLLALRQQLQDVGLKPPCRWKLVTKEQAETWELKRLRMMVDGKEMTSKDMTLDLPNFFNELDELKPLTYQKLTEHVKVNYTVKELILELRAWGRTGHYKKGEAWVVSEIVKTLWDKMHGEDVATENEARVKGPKRKTTV